MMNTNQIYFAAGTVFLLACSVAISQEAVKVARSGDKVAPRAPVVKRINKLASPITKPSVVMSAGHKSTCLKSVGDTIADATVTDIKGSDHKLGELLSDRFTVLIFWAETSRPAMEQFRRIPIDVLGSFAKHRVKVITANVGGDVASTRRITGDAADKIVSLVDKDSNLFRQFASSRIPRTYLLDKSGKILWFDIEYSRSTQRELNNALNYYLQQK